MNESGWVALELADGLGASRANVTVGSVLHNLNWGDGSVTAERNQSHKPLIRSFAAKIDKLLRHAEGLSK